MNKEAIDACLNKLTLELSYMGEPAPHTIYQYRNYCRRFLEPIEGTPTRQDVEQFISKFDAPRTKKFIHAALKVLFFANDWELKLRKGPTLTVDTHYPELSYEDLSHLIDCRDILDERENAYLALASTFGFRRCEMASLSRENFSDGLIAVTRKKGGEPRVHQLPEEIKDIIYSYRFKPLSDSYLSKIFQRMFKKVELKRQNGMGWHAVRSLLVTELLNGGVDPVTITKYIGWKTMPRRFEYEDISKMMSVYARPEYRERDTTVFDSHPFLPLYRE